MENDFNLPPGHGVLDQINGVKPRRATWRGGHYRPLFDPDALTDPTDESGEPPEKDEG